MFDKVGFVLEEIIFNHTDVMRDLIQRILNLNLRDGSISDIIAQKINLFNDDGKFFHCFEETLGALGLGFGSHDFSYELVVKVGEGKIHIILINVICIIGDGFTECLESAILPHGAGRAIPLPQQTAHSIDFIIEASDFGLEGFDLVFHTHMIPQRTRGINK